MTTGVGEETPTGVGLSEILQVIEGVLVVETTDLATAYVAFRGAQYLLALEFARRQPALALLYDLDVELIRIERGSFRFVFKILVKAKKRVAAELKKAGVVATLSMALALPGAINEGDKIFHELFPPVQAQLQKDIPYSSPTFEIRVIRAPDDRDIFDRDTPRSFTLGTDDIDT
jgi:hypothetical protein